MTDTRKLPVAGIRFSGKGYCGNRHFSTLEFAQEEFEKELIRTRETFSNNNGKYIETNLPIADSLIKNVQIKNLKKNGKPGKYSWTVQLYSISDNMASRFMEDRLYSVEK